MNPFWIGLQGDILHILKWLVCTYIHIWDFLMAQMVKSLPAMWETWVRFLGREDRLEKEMATHSSILAWKIPRTEGAWQATIHEVSKSQTQLSDFTRRQQKSLNCVWLFATSWTIQSRILELVAFPFFRASSQPRDWTLVSPLQADSLPAEPQGKL